MLRDILKNHKVILASGSPRRQDFFKELDLDFKIQVKAIDETYPSHLTHSQITDYISQQKAAAFNNLQRNEILITSDTIVWLNEAALEKPKNTEHAKEMLRKLSGQMHEVITSVCFTTSGFQKTVHDVTKVWFKTLSDSEIDYYIKNYQPFDKAGGYGIQEWIGYIGIEKIEGCYFNVISLPIRLVYKTLSDMATR